MLEGQADLLARAALLRNRKRSDRFDELLVQPNG